MSPDQPHRPGQARSLGFRRAQRLQRKRDFERTFREGSRARGDLLLVVVAANGLPYSRLGLSVGRAVWKRAVQRNRVRRIFREAFRLAQHELPPGLDVVLVPAKKQLQPALEATRRELVQLTRKAHRRYREKLAAQTPGAPAPPERRP